MRDRDQHQKSIERSVRLSSRGVNTLVSKFLRNVFIQNIIFTVFGVFTDKPYSRLLERNVVYSPIITLSHATLHDFKWRQNKPWLSTILLDVGDVIDAVPLLAEKLRVNVFLQQF